MTAPITTHTHTHTAAALLARAESLREAAALLEAHPDLPGPYITSGSLSGGRHWIDVTWQLLITDGLTLEGQKAAAVQIMRAVGGQWNKRDGGVSFHFEQQRGPLKMAVSVDREAVCERVVTGTETVTIPAKAAEPERVEQREVVEWRCEPVLAEATS